MRYYEFGYLVEGYPQAQAAFIQQSSGDTAGVQKTIAAFKQLVTRNQVKDVNQKNIDWWMKQGWDKFSQFVNQAAAIPSKSQVEKKKLPGQSINLVDNANWLIVIPLNKDASCFHGKDSDWCTTKTNQSYFEQYFYDNEIVLIYCLNKTNGEMWAIAAHKKTVKVQLFDKKNERISGDEFQQQTGLDPKQLFDMAMGQEHQPVIQQSLDTYHRAIKLVYQLLRNLPEGTRSAEIEKQLIFTRSGEQSGHYIRIVGPDNSSAVPFVIQLLAVNQDGFSIGNIDNPTQKLQLAAINKNWHTIKYIKNPTLKAQLAAVNKNGDAIQYINNPTPELQLAAVNKNGGAIQFIDNPTPELQLIAVKQNGYAIQFIDNPTPELQLIAVKQDGLAIRYIKNPTPKLQLAAVKQDGFAIRYIKDPTLRMQIIAVKKNDQVIAHIENPPPVVQLAAVKQNPSAIGYIRIAMRTPQAIQLAKSKGFG